MQPEPQEIPEEAMEGLQPGAFEVAMCQGLPLFTKRVGGGRVREVCQIHTYADGSMQEMPIQVPGGLWDQGRTQAGPPRTLPLAKGVPLFGVWAKYQWQHGGQCGA